VRRLDFLRSWSEIFEANSKANVALKLLRQIIVHVAKVCPLQRQHRHDRQRDNKESPTLAIR
jgi:hypothetical protein